MLKKTIFAGLLALIAGSAHAFTESFDKGFSTAAVVGVSCSSGTATDITQTLAGYSIAGYRASNAHASAIVYFGYNSLVSTDSASAFFSVPVAAAGNAVFSIGRSDAISGTPVAVRLWCKAADAATSGIRVALEVFGYK